MFGTIEVLFLHKPGSDKQRSWAGFGAALQPAFDVEGREFIGQAQFDSSKQIVRIIAINNAYASGREFDTAVKSTLIENGFADSFNWTRTRGIRVGGTEVDPT